MNIGSAVWLDAGCRFGRRIRAASVAPYSSKQVRGYSHRRSVREQIKRDSHPPSSFNFCTMFSQVHLNTVAPFQCQELLSRTFALRLAIRLHPGCLLDGLDRKVYADLLCDFETPLANLLQPSEGRRAVTFGRCLLGIIHYRNFVCPAAPR